MKGDPREVARRRLLAASDEFHMKIGYCVAGWAAVDDAIFNICHAVLQCPKQQAAIVFYKTPGLEARITLTDELVRSILPSHKPGEHQVADLKAWTDIRKQAQSLLPIRNRIAHHPVWTRGLAYYYGNPDPDDPEFRKAPPPESAFEISENYNEQSRGRSVKSPLRISDLSKHQNATLGVYAQLQEFHYRRLVPLLAKRPRQ